MKCIYEKWWDNENKVFQITNYKKAWKEVGNKPMFKLTTNGANKRNGDTCLDINLVIGYTIISYTNFNL